MEQTVEKLWEKHHQKIPGYVLSYEDDGDSDGTHLPDTKEIVLRLKVMDNTLRKISDQGVVIPKVAYAVFVLVHEMGHAMDETLKGTKEKVLKLVEKRNNVALLTLQQVQYLHEEVQRLIMDVEIKAWNLGKSLLPENANLELYETAQDYCLSTYVDHLKWEGEQYNMLVKVAEKIHIINREMNYQGETNLNYNTCYASKYNFESKRIELYFKTLYTNHRCLTNKSISAEEVIVFTYYRELCRSKVRLIEELLQERKQNKRFLSAEKIAKMPAALEEIERINTLIELSLVNIANSKLPSCIDAATFRAFNQEMLNDLKTDQAETREYYEEKLEILKKRAS